MKRCKALLICREGTRTQSAFRVGSPCNAQAVAKRDGRDVCWLHKGALRPLEYAKKHVARRMQQMADAK